VQPRLQTCTRALSMANLSSNQSLVRPSLRTRLEQRSQINVNRDACGQNKMKTSRKQFSSKSNFDHLLSFSSIAGYMFRFLRQALPGNVPEFQAPYFFASMEEMEREAPASGPLSLLPVECHLAI